MWGAATLGLFCVRFFLHKRSGPICVSSRGESVTEIHISNSMYVFYISVVADGSRYFCDLEGGYTEPNVRCVGQSRNDFPIHYFGFYSLRDLEYSDCAKKLLKSFFYYYYFLSEMCLIDFHELVIFVSAQQLEVNLVYNVNRGFVLNIILYSLL